MAVSTSTTTISGSRLNKINGGTILNAGNVSKLNRDGYNLFSALTQAVNNLNTDKLQGLVVASNSNGVGFILGSTASAVTITGITQSGSTGYCNIQKSSHGLTVGTVIQVNGTNVNSYNVIHKVTVVTDANNVKTDIRYVSNTTTHGTYSRMTTNSTFAKMAARKYIVSVIGNQVAGLSSSFLLTMGAANSQPYNASNGTYGTSITGFDYFTGAKTTGATWGVLNKFHDIDNNNQNLVTEPHPTRAIPGKLVFLSGALVPVVKNYNPKT